VSTATGPVAVWNSAEVGEHGLFMIAFDSPTSSQQSASCVTQSVIEDGGVDETVAVLRCYLAGPSVPGRAKCRDLRRRLAEALQIEEGQL
jgi:hypothetical protein